MMHRGPKGLSPKVPREVRRTASGEITIKLADAPARGGRLQQDAFLQHLACGICALVHQRVEGQAASPFVSAERYDVSPSAGRLRSRRISGLPEASNSVQSIATVMLSRLPTT